jgi:hypothetical protein
MNGSGSAGEQRPRGDGALRELDPPSVRKVWQLPRAFQTPDGQKDFEVTMKRQPMFVRDILWGQIRAYNERKGA